MVKKKTRILPYNLLINIVLLSVFSSSTEASLLSDAQGFRLLSEGLISQFYPKNLWASPHGRQDHWIEAGLLMGVVQPSSVSAPLKELPGLSTVSDQVSAIPVLPSVPMGYFYLHPYRTLNFELRGIPKIGNSSVSVSVFSAGASWSYLNQWMNSLPIDASLRFAYNSAKIASSQVTIGQTGIYFLHNLSKTWGATTLAWGAGFGSGTLALDANASAISISEAPRSSGAITSLSSIWRLGAFDCGVEWAWIAGSHSFTTKLGFSI
jgi:hypothetical protein